MIVRKLWPWEGGAIRGHLLRLGPEDRMMRFCAPASDRFIHDYCAQIDPIRTLALGCFVDGTLRGVAELIRIPGECPVSAELDLSVEPPFQGRGIGGRLMRKALAVARNRLVGAVYVVFLPENQPMRRLLERHGASITTCSAPGEARIALPWPAPASALEEIATESQALLATLPGPGALGAGTARPAGAPGASPAG